MRGQGKGMKAATPDSGRRVQPRQPMRRPAATGQEAAGHAHEYTEGHALDHQVRGDGKGVADVRLDCLAAIAEVAPFVIVHGVMRHPEERAGAEQIDPVHAGGVDVLNIIGVLENGAIEDFHGFLRALVSASSADDGWR